MKVKNAIILVAPGEPAYGDPHDIFCMDDIPQPLREGLMQWLHGAKPRETVEPA